MHIKNNWLYANLLVIALGVLLRFRNFMGGKSLTLDEIYAALHFQQYGLFELFQPIEIPHWSPIGFLAITRMFINMFGDSEYVYRLLPFIAGCVSLLLFYRFVKELLQPYTVLYCNILFSLSGALVFYSNEFKPYILDAMCGVLLTSLLFRYTKNKLSVVEGIIMGLTGGLLVWFSFTITFVMAGAGTTIGLRYFLMKESYSFRNAVLMVGLWLGSFGVNYILFVKGIPQIPQMVVYWSQRSDYMPLLPTSYSDILWFKNNALQYFEEVAGLRRMGAFLFICFCVGSLHLVFLKKYYIYLYLTLPLVFVLVASALEVYPFSGRLVLFTVPFALIVSGFAFELLEKRIGQRAKLYILSLMLVSVLPVFVVSARKAISGDKSSGVREIVVQAGDYMQGNDTLVCYPFKEPFVYYINKLDISIREPSELNMSEVSDTLIELEETAHDSSIWLGFSVRAEADREELLHEFRVHFRETASFTDISAGLYQFQKR